MCVSKGALITLPSWHLMAIPVAPQPAGSQQAVCWPMERPGAVGILQQHKACIAACSMLLVWDDPSRVTCRV